MTDVTSDSEAGKTSVSGTGAVDDGLVAELVARAQAGGVKLTGEGGLLQQLTKRVLESALEGELTDHLGHEPGERAEGGRENYRNGHRSKTVITESGPVEITVPRDRAGSFEPRLVRKRQRRMGGVDEMVLSLSAKGLTHGEISAHLAEVYGAEISKSTISTITDSVMAGMTEWQNRPLDSVYPVVFIDCVNVKVRDGQVANRPVYMAVAVTAEGHRDILGLWIGDGGEGAKYWLQVLTEIKNRGAADVLMLVCDGLTGLPDAVNTVWPATIVQTSSVHTPWWRESPAGHRASGRGPMQTCCLRGPHADPSLSLEAGRELASGSRASSAEMRYQRGRPVGDLDRQDGSYGPLVTHQHHRSSRSVRRRRLGQRPSAALPRGRGRPGRAPKALRPHR